MSVETNVISVSIKILKGISIEYFQDHYMETKY